MTMKTSNPALSERVFQNLPLTAGERMTVGGTVNKSFILISLVLASALWSWSQAYPTGWGLAVAPQIPGWYFPVLIASFVASLIIIFKKTSAPYLTPVYAILEGLALGAISAMFEFKYPGIAMQA